MQRGRGFLAGMVVAFVAMGVGACGARTGLPGLDDTESGTGGVGGSPGPGGGGPGPGPGPSSGGGGEGGGGGFGGQGGAGGQGGVGGVEQVALGAGHSCLRTFEGRVYCWGHNNRGQLGLGDEVDRLSPAEVELDGPASYLATGAFHTCAVLADGGELRCWGDHGRGQVGIGLTATDEILSPAPVALSGVDELALGEEHSCARIGDAVYCWGNNASGQVGDGTQTDRVAPVLVPSAATTQAIAAGGFHSLAIDAGGTVRCWGANGLRECGIPGMGQPVVLAPQPVPGLANEDLTVLRGGLGRHSLGISGVRLIGWGANANGQLGLGFDSPFELPSALVPSPGEPPTDVRPGFAHTCALVSTQVWCWGDNLAGKLGVGSAAAEITTPTQVPGLAGVVAIGAGTQHTGAYLSPTDIRCWGGNAFGQLGTGDTQPRDTPTSIALP